MRRNITIAAVTAAVLIGGGSYTAFAMGDQGEDHGHDGRVQAARTAVVTPAAPSASGTRTASGTPSAAGARTALTAGDAAAAALKKYPGAVASVEREDGARWEVELLGRDGTWRELKIDAGTGAVRADDRDHGDRDSAERKVLQGAGVSAQRAAAAALAATPGSV
ncbi:hypothetical protein QR77_28595, partial [Streptomyces sp. 150FB]|uniref:PepSY domain-containing protein n=1 Tax=Streptomyces sp. 150FB TaxID=1576605 RepID=UPI00058905E5